MAVAAPSPPTLEELLGSVPAENLDEQCTDCHLLELAKSLTKWQSVSPFLRLTEVEEENIKEGPLERQRIDVLRRWKRKLGTTATYR